MVSTTAAKDPTADTSGDLLKDTFAKDGGDNWEVVETKIVGDNVTDIQLNVMQWADKENPVNLIISTGGTGFATFDNTPEVCRKVLREHRLSLTCAGYLAIDSSSCSWTRSRDAGCFSGSHSM